MKNGMRFAIAASSAAALISGCDATDNRKSAFNVLKEACDTTLSVELRMGSFGGDQVIVKCERLKPGFEMETNKK